MVIFKNIVKKMQQAIKPNTYIEKSTQSAQLLPAISVETPKRLTGYPLLTTLMHNRQFIEIIVNDGNESFQSMILAVDVKRRLLWLDELYPTLQGLQVEDQIRIKHHQKGEILSFKAPIVALGSSFNREGIAILLPEQVRYQPRRQFIRHDLHGGEVRTKIRVIGEEPRYGSIINLSAGGMRLAIAGNILSELHLNGLLPLCQFSLNNDLNIDCHARVKSYKIERQPYRHTQVSLEFTDISFTEQMQLRSHLEQTHRLPNTQAA